MQVVFRENDGQNPRCVSNWHISLVIQPKGTFPGRVIAGSETMVVLHLSRALNNQRDESRLLFIRLLHPQLYQLNDCIFLPSSIVLVLRHCKHASQMTQLKYAMNLARAK